MCFLNKLATAADSLSIPELRNEKDTRCMQERSFGNQTPGTFLFSIPGTLLLTIHIIERHCV